MAAFDYRALDKAGRRHRGIIAAENARLARSELRRRGLLPLALEATARNTASDGHRRARRPSRSERLMLIRQLATMIGAGATVTEALAAIAAESRQPALRALILELRSAISGGLSLSQAMAGHPRAFPPLHVALIAAGEKAGALETVLARLAAHLEQQARTARKLMTALAYPLMLAFVATGVVLALMLFVVPKLVEQFADLGGQLPRLTRLMIFLSDALVAYGPWLLLLVVGAAIAGAQALRRPGIRFRFDSLLLRLPGIGRAVRTLAALHIARVLAMLVGAGIPVTEALVAARETAANRAVGQRLERATVEVREGSTLGAALERADVLPPMVVAMAALGERSGRLPVMLERAADHLEEALDGFTATLMSLVEPAIVIVMGGIVATIVLAILLPILRLNTLAF